jgi:hypothetical protein
VNDFLGQEVKVGDYVVTNVSGKGLTFGLVEKITPKKVKVLYMSGWAKTLDSVHKDHDAVSLVTAETSTFRARREQLKKVILAKITKDLAG